MKFISWNVNGLRACMQKGFSDFFAAADADFFCLQETKLQEGQIQLDLPGYCQHWCYAEKKAIPARLFSQRALPSPSATVWAFPNWTPKAGSSLWNMPISSWSPATPPMRNGVWPGWITV